METVLGLSMTSSGVGWVLLDGLNDDGTALDHDAFDVVNDAADDGGISKHAVAAVRGAQAIAAASGHHVKSIGVTWTDGADSQAALVLKALPDLGFEDVVTVRLPEAVRVWAQSFGSILEFEKCAVCVVEPAAVTVLTVGYDTVRTSVTHTRESADGLSRWLTDAFEQNRWKPENLFLVGSRADLELVSGSLEEALSMPVDASDEAQLALARGAALALPPKPEVLGEQAGEQPINETPAHRRPRLGSHARAATVLVAGVIAVFAVGPELAGHDESRSTANRPAVNSSPTSVSSAASNTATTSASVHAVPSPVRPPAPAQVRPLAAPPPPPPPPTPPPPPPARAPAEALPASDALPAQEPDAADDEQVTATPVVAPVAAPQAPVAAQPVVAPQAPVAEPPVAAPPLPVAAPPPPFGLPAWLFPPPAPAAAPPAPVAAQPALAPPAPAASPPAPAASPPAPPPAPAAPPPANPGPAPASNPAQPPAPPPDPIGQVLSPFFGALP